MSRYKEIDLNSITPTSVEMRDSKVETGQMASVPYSGMTVKEFIAGLPPVLAAADFSFVVNKIADAKEAGKPVILMMGAHVIKVGLGPVVIDMMETGILSSIAFNGAGAIHDSELAYFGKTSEDVARFLSDGKFGMAKETAMILNTAADNAAEHELGLGESLGKKMAADKPPYAALSIAAAAYRLGVPLTVHVALGTDIVHQHPTARGESIGAASMRDFRIFANCVSEIGEGGVVLVFGSSVVLPEVFLKALTVARNIHGQIINFYTASFDMLRHYRPQVNVVTRPVQDGGRGVAITGHHELMLPLLSAGVKDVLAGRESAQV